MIKGKINDDLNKIQVGTNIPLIEHPKEVLKKSEKWFWRRCDNKIVTVLSKWEVKISKMAALWPY